jgi:hypothetical protein
MHWSLMGSIQNCRRLLDDATSAARYVAYSGFNDDKLHIAHPAVSGCSAELAARVVPAALQCCTTCDNTSTLVAVYCNAAMTRCVQLHPAAISRASPAYASLCRKFACTSCQAADLWTIVAAVSAAGAAGPARA